MVRQAENGLMTGDRRPGAHGGGSRGRTVLRSVPRLAASTTHRERTHRSGDRSGELGEEVARRVGDGVAR